jgi:hypothetical protein
MRKKTGLLWKTAGATCALAGLISTWDSTAEAQYNISGAITPTSNLSDVYFIFTVGLCYPGGGTFDQEIASFIPANTTYSFNLSFDSIPAGLPLNGFTVLGLYDTVNGGVSIGYDANQAADVLAASPAPEWNSPSLPAGSASDGSVYYQYVGASESDAANALAGGLSGGSPLTAAGNPFPGLSTDPLNPSSFALIDFSGASNGGSGYAVEVVPEPSVTAFLAAGSALFSFGWLRRRRAG